MALLVLCFHWCESIHGHMISQQHCQIINVRINSSSYTCKYNYMYTKIYINKALVYMSLGEVKYM